MNSDDLRERLLAAELAHLKTEIIAQLCRWSRCRDDRDLLTALQTVDALVSIEDDSAWREVVARTESADRCIS